MQYIYIELRLNLCCFCADPPDCHLVLTPTPITIWVHTTTCAPVRLNWPSLFIGHQAPPARVPCTAAAIPCITAARVCRSPCTAVARVRRPPCVATTHVRRHPPIVGHAHSPPILSRAGPPLSPDVDLDHQIRVLRSVDFMQSRPIGDLLPQIDRAPPLRR
jgi:hypothetical protein